MTGYQHILWVLVFGLLCWILPDNVIAQVTEKERLEQSRKKIEEEIEYTNKLLEQTKTNKQASLNTIVLLNKKIKNREKLIQSINKEIDDIDERISRDNRALVNLSYDLHNLKEEYARMIRFAYKNMHSFNKLVFIFSSNDFYQAYRRLKYYQQYSEARTKQAAMIQGTQRAINRKISEMEKQKSSKVSLAEAKLKEKKKLDKEKNEKNNAVKTLSQKEKQLLATIREKEKSAQKLKTEIQRIIAEEIRLAEARAGKTKSEPSASSKKTSTDTKPTPVIRLTPEETALSNSFAQNKGKLPWPSEKGVITESYGEHAHAVLKHVKTKNNGIDILTEKGASARAVFAGKVTRVMSFPKGNKVVIIRHGEYLTVYSNLSEVSVKDGEAVKTKQVIGKIQTDSETSRTELHFELWLGKTTQDPAIWLAGGK